MYAADGTEVVPSALSMNISSTEWENIEITGNELYSNTGNTVVLRNINGAMLTDNDITSSSNSYALVVENTSFGVDATYNTFTNTANEFNIVNWNADESTSTYENNTETALS